MILLMIKWYRNDIINDKNNIEMITIISFMIKWYRNDIINDKNDKNDIINDKMIKRISLMIK